MRRDRRSARSIWIYCAAGLALAVSSAACADSTNDNPRTGSGATSSGSGGAGGQAGFGGAAGHGGAGGTAGGGMGGMGGTGGTSTISTGSSGGGGSGGCGPDEKLCFGFCVSTGDPTVGCGDPACDPCNQDHAQAGCVGGACSIVKCDADWANCDGDAANGCEVNLPADPLNCGACGSPCVVPNGTPGCQGGLCVVDACDPPWVDCDGDVTNGCEANPDVDPNDCGSCNNVCAPGEQCQGGICGVFCPLGKANCDGDALNGCEVDLGTVADCAFCGDACQLSQASSDCQAGACVVVACSPGYDDCDNVDANGCEVPLDTSASDCGACGQACPFGPNSTAVCSGGVCDLVCAGGYENCNGDPTDGCEQGTLTDPSHCGGCNLVCVTPNATPACQAGVCKIATCNPGFADCDLVVANGCEVSLDSDPAHCGSCGNTCPTPPNASATCAGGACGYTCDAGFADCDGLAANGCEIDLQTDPTHCGSCANACNLANAVEGCSAGSCTIASCDNGFDDCDGLVPNGCEVNLQTDPTHCGACPTVCNLANATQLCSGGTCQIGACNAPFANCDGLTPNGCETNTDSSIPNCGACNQPCDVANGTPACAGGQCLVAGCSAGFANCNNLVSDGCEINTNTSVANCGACGSVCNLPNASQACVGGSCAIGSCNGTFANCDNVTANGCEIDTATSLANCGACGDVCDLANAADACVGGSCLISSCNAGFGNCDGLTPNGCETNTNSSVGNCGTCGNACNLANASEVCNNGSCAIAVCDAGFANCDNQTPNGCEVDTNTSIGNCGGCGNACNLANAANACTNSSCAIASCNAGFANCDNQTPNGCEVNTNTSVGNCGGCGNACNLANAVNACSAGSCAIASCNAGFGNCDNQTANGCETNLNSSVGNCGSCGNACSFANAGASCSNGSCAMGSCNGGFGNCDNQPANGCETNLNSSVGNCGGCGNACNLPNASASCTNGSCGVASCNLPFSNCDGQPANGCETNLAADAQNCGGCGNVCNLPNAVPACAGGLCAVGACLPGWADCDGNPANGCEVNISNSVGNCGGCGTTCSVANGTAACVGGTCQVGSCNGGFSNCNNLPVDGCEVNTNTSVGNCGGCGQICAPANSTGQCSNGTCVVGSCNPGFQNCNGQQGDGCEINLQADVQNCGTCGNNCAVSCAGNTTLTQCTSGACAIQACQPGYYNVDGLCSGGCECQASNVAQSCNTPTSLGTINVGGPAITTSANLVPLGVEAWYTVTFTGNGSSSYHPRVRFTVNPGNAYQFDIRTNCAGATLGCGIEGGISNAMVDWEVFNTGPLPGYYNPIPPVGNNGTILIHVFRKAGQPLSCQPFTLQISN